MSAILFTTPSAIFSTGGFDLSVHMLGSEPITGLDYTLNLVNAELVSRDLAGSAFPDVIDPSLAGDLGASVLDVRLPVSGEQPVAMYHFRVKDPALTAIVTPQAFPGTLGYATGAPDFAEFPFAQFQGTTITTPEPTLGLALAAALLWRWLAGRDSSRTPR